MVLNDICFYTGVDDERNITNESARNLEIYKLSNFDHALIYYLLSKKLLILTISFCIFMKICLCVFNNIMPT